MPINHAFNNKESFNTFENVSYSYLKNFKMVTKKMAYHLAADKIGRHINLRMKPRNQLN